MGIPYEPPRPNHDRELAGKVEKFFKARFRRGVKLTKAHEYAQRHGLNLVEAFLGYHNQQRLETPGVEIEAKLEPQEAVGVGTFRTSNAPTSDSKIDINAEMIRLQNDSGFEKHVADYLFCTVPSSATTTIHYYGANGQERFAVMDEAHYSVMKFKEQPQVIEGSDYVLKRGEKFSQRFTLSDRSQDTTDFINAFIDLCDGSQTRYIATMEREIVTTQLIQRETGRVYDLTLSGVTTEGVNEQLVQMEVEFRGAIWGFPQAYQVDREDVVLGEIHHISDGIMESLNYRPSTTTKFQWLFSRTQ